MTGTTSQILVDKVADWLMTQALAETDLETIVRGCCERMAATGLPIARANLSFAILHPLYRAMGFTWRRGSGLEIEGYRHVDTEIEDRYLHSPFFHMTNNALDYMRRRIDADSRNEFPIFGDLHEHGITDYLAFRSMFSPESDRGMIGSWSTDREGGFHDSEIAALLSIQSKLAVACKMAVQSVLANNMMSTYLGSDAGNRVLSGQIRRGEGETIRAAIVMGDIRGSTMHAEQLGRQAYIDLLDDFFDNTADAFADHGGQILSFLGDGFLAIFPCERHRASSEEAALRMATAACEAVTRMKATNEARESRGVPPIGFGLGLHIGNVMYGNVGLADRMTFSVFGTAVNEASRLEQLSKKYEVPIVASDEFVGYCDGEWKKLGNETLRGLSEPIDVYTPKTVFCAQGEKALRQIGTGFSDAERVVLLHRDRPAAAS